MAITAWVWVACDPPSGDLSGQILFRGDDRSGLDPYSLCINDSGYLQFQVTNAENTSIIVAATPPAKVTVTAGHYATGFQIKTAAVKTTQTGKISVTVNGVTLTANLTVTP